MDFREMNTKELIPIITLFVLVIILSVLNPEFLTLYNIHSVFIQASVLLVLATGITFIILTGGIDLSVGALISLSGVLIAILLPHLGYFAFVVVVLCGSLAGLVNGLVITRGKVPSFIVTLGTSGIWLSMAYVLCDGKPISLPSRLGIYRLWIVGKTFGISNIILISLFIVLVFWYILNKTTFGKYIFSIGNGE
ncbi:MAG: ABC transporter permease, partial [Halanaerobiaceae bacterium]